MILIYVVIGLLVLVTTVMLAVVVWEYYALSGRIDQVSSQVPCVPTQCRSTFVDASKLTGVVGSDDCSGVLNALFSNTTSNLTIFFPSGQYKIANNVVIPKDSSNISIIGESGAVFLKMPTYSSTSANSSYSPTTANVSIVIDGSYCTIANIDINGNHVYGANVFITGNHNTLENVISYNGGGPGGQVSLFCLKDIFIDIFVFKKGLNIDGSSATPTEAAGSYNTLSKCQVFNNEGIGISQSHATYSMVSNCICWGNGNEGITVDNDSFQCIVESCMLIDNALTHGGRGQIGTDSCVGVTISGNNISTTTTSALASIGLAATEDLISGYVISSNVFNLFDGSAFAIWMDGSGDFNWGVLSIGGNAMNLKNGQPASDLQLYTQTGFHDGITPPTLKLYG